MIRNKENPSTSDARHFRQNGLSPPATSQGGGQRPQAALRALQMGKPRHGAPLSVEHPPPEPSPSLEKFPACLGQSSVALPSCRLCPRVWARAAGWGPPLRSELSPAVRGTSMHTHTHPRHPGTRVPGHTKLPHPPPAAGRAGRPRSARGRAAPGAQGLPGLGWRGSEPGSALLSSSPPHTLLPPPPSTPSPHPPRGTDRVAGVPEKRGHPQPGRPRELAAQDRARRSAGMRPARRTRGAGRGPGGDRRGAYLAHEEKSWRIVSGAEGESE